MQRDGPTFDEINKIFNNNLKRRHVVPNDGPFPPPTGPHGNEEWYYEETNNDSTKIYADFFFRQNGQLGLALFSYLAGMLNEFAAQHGKITIGTAAARAAPLADGAHRRGLRGLVALEYACHGFSHRNR